ncbi:MAG TPA: DegT/DnrJ/EryC1/StrS family aminotransferase, partial [Leptospiraceae bacterium]|nr:DegT/DnrJ/EryC1/StrS family aminotransferase [Leptospiraceae bacterium]
MKLIPRLKPYYSFSEWLSILQFGRKSVQRLEKEFAEKFECRYGVMFSYGRTALYALFKVWNLQNAEIICPAYTCVVVQHSIVLSGNIPVFADCEEGSFNMSLSEIRRAVTEKTRAVVVTHLFGTAMDVNAVNEIVREAERKYNH